MFERKFSLYFFKTKMSTQGLQYFFNDLFMLFGPFYY